MSLRAMLWVLDDAPVSDPYELAILVALADEANDEGLSCYPELRRIARRARQSVSTVRKRLAALEARGLVVVVRPERQGRGHHNRYGLVMGRCPLAVGNAVRNDEKRVAVANPSEPETRAEPPRNARKSARHGARKPVDPKLRSNPRPVPPLFQPDDQVRARPEVLRSGIESAKQALKKPSTNERGNP